jgi:hypothetical protein
MINAGHRYDLRGNPFGNGSVRRVGEYRVGFPSDALDGQFAALKAASGATGKERVGVATLAGRRRRHCENWDAARQRAEGRPRAAIADQQRAVRQQRRLRDESLDMDAFWQWAKRGGVPLRPNRHD